MTGAESNLFDKIKENEVSDRGANYYGSSTRISDGRSQPQRSEPTPGSSFNDDNRVVSLMLNKSIIYNLLFITHLVNLYFSQLLLGLASVKISVYKRMAGKRKDVHAELQTSNAPNVAHVGQKNYFVQTKTDFGLGYVFPQHKYVDIV